MEAARCDAVNGCEITADGQLLSCFEGRGENRRRERVGLETSSKRSLFTPVQRREAAQQLFTKSIVGIPAASRLFPHDLSYVYDNLLKVLHMFSG